MAEHNGEDPYTIYCSEINRLKSFENYTSTDCNFSDKTKENYARAGFYWSGVGEKVKCNFCHFYVFRLLEDEEDPIQLHNSYNSSCPFICRLPTDNIPIDEKLLDKILPKKTTFEAGSKPPKYPQYSTLASRVDSFRHWPSTNCMRVEDLVAAGFFYLGDGDKVGCFHCGLALKEFNGDEIPWDTHKKLRSQCGFIKKSIITYSVIPAKETQVDVVPATSPKKNIPYCRFFIFGGALAVSLVLLYQVGSRMFLETLINE